MRELLVSLIEAENHIRSRLKETLTDDEIKELLKSVKRPNYPSTAQIQKYGSKLWGITALILIGRLKANLPADRAILTSEYTSQVFSQLSNIFRCGTLYGAVTSDRIDQDEKLAKIRHSNALRVGNRNPKHDGLHNVLTEIVEECRAQNIESSINNVMNALRRRAGKGDILTADSSQVKWYNNVGSTEETGRKSIANRLTRIRKDVASKLSS